MKNQVGWFLLSSFLVTTLLAAFALAEEAKIAVLNPRGIAPPIRRIPMASRLDSLDGKTIYVVDTRYPLTEPFVQQVHQILSEKYPKTSWVFKNKIGSYFDDDPNLWAEIKEKGHGMIMAIGH